MEDNEMDHNFNIADLFAAVEKFKAIVTRLRNTMTGDEVERKRLKIVMGMVKKDIHAMFEHIGKED